MLKANTQQENETGGISERGVVKAWWRSPMFNVLAKRPKVEWPSKKEDNSVNKIALDRYHESSRNM